MERQHVKWWQPDALRCASATCLWEHPWCLCVWPPYLVCLEDSISVLEDNMLLPLPCSLRPEAFSLQAERGEYITDLLPGLR